MNENHDFGQVKHNVKLLIFSFIILTFELDLPLQDGYVNVLAFSLWIHLFEEAKG